MGNHPRKADGRQVFSAEFKRTTVQRILTGEKTVAELSRELDIAPSVIRNWARHPMISVIPPGMASPTMAANPHDLPLRATDDPERSCALKREALGTVFTK